MIFILALIVSLISGCKKADYDCEQKITTIKISGTKIDSNSQYDNFQIIGNAKCVIGKSSKETINPDNTKTIVVTDTKCY